MHGIHFFKINEMPKKRSKNGMYRDIQFEKIAKEAGLVYSSIDEFGVINLLKDRGANSIEVATLLDKPSGRTVKCQEPKYIGATIEPKFVVGFGLDYNQLYRNLDYVGVLKRSVYEKK